MTFRDYSQSGEQAAILEATRELEVGRFLDLGAGDGESFSNSRALALAGWGGVAVEPAAWAFARLAALYAANDRVEAVSAVVTERERGLVPFLYVEGDHLSSTDPEQAIRWAAVPFVATLAAAVTLSDVLDRWARRPFSVVSIDVEGLSRALLEAYQRHPLWESVRVAVVEHEPGLSRPAGFELAARTANNEVYVR